MLINSCLQFALLIKVFKIIVGVNVDGLLSDLPLGELANPLVLQTLFGGRSLGRIYTKHSLYQIFARFAHILPLLLRKLEAARLDSFKDNFIVDSVEGRISANKNVENHSAAPNIAFLVILPS